MIWIIKYKQKTMKNKLLLVLALSFCLVLGSNFAKAATNNQAITLKQG
jgi:hypothetical protein